MTDDPTELHDLVSAYLDGEVSSAERARVESDPELLTRVEELRRVSEAVGGEVPPLDDAVASAQRRRARLAGEDDAPPGRSAPPVPARRRPTWLPSPAAAAAAIIVIALVGVLLIIGPTGGGDADDAATSGGPSPAGVTSGDGGEGAAPEAATEDATEDLEDLGSFATQADLTRALDAVDVTTLSSAADTTAPTTSEATSEAEVARCDQTVEAQGDLDARLAVATARLAGERVLVFSHPVAADEGEPVTQLSVVDADDCRVLFAVQR